MRRAAVRAFVAILVFHAAAAASAAVSLPTDRRHVYDLEEWLEPQGRQALEARLAAYESSTGHRIVVLTAAGARVGSGDTDVAALAAEADRVWSLSADKAQASVLLLYGGWGATHVFPSWGAPVPSLQGAVPDILRTMEM